MTFATSADAIAHFSAKLGFETDPSDVYAERKAGSSAVLVDVRNEAAWLQGRAAGAIHLPRPEIAERAAELIPAGTEVIVYCWSPGCNGGTKAALEFARLGYPVKEMIGGFEYWTREGLEIVDDSGSLTRAVDTLTGPRPSNGVISCDC
jgi:rhodanese-related sulfurtransferase